MKAKSTLLSLLLLFSLNSCTRSTLPSLPPEIRARVEALDTALVIPEGLSPDERIIFVENAVLTSPVTAEELLALHEVHTLDPEDPVEEVLLTRRNQDEVRLANRFMRMHYVSMGDPDDELQWVLAVRTAFADYRRQYGRTEDESLDDLLDGVDFLAIGSQPEINLYCYISSSVEYYKTITAYVALFEEVGDVKLLGLLRNEYGCWSRMNKARHAVYVRVKRAGERYSALPMELEAEYAAYAIARREELAMERSILFAGAEYQRKHPVVRAAEWVAYLDSLSGPERSGEVTQFEATVRDWLDARHALTRYLGALKGAAYDRLTADIHWEIVHDAIVHPEWS